ncbi:MAG: restriction endonuclease subunit S [Bacteroidetes bacterium]|nr:restriction endonuclease subunit S [Bacteroidota bacterium]
MTNLNHQFKDYRKGNAQENLNQDKISNIEFHFPSLHEQIKIADFLFLIDEKINRTRNQIEKTVQYKQGLIQNMYC